MRLPIDTGTVKFAAIRAEEILGHGTQRVEKHQEALGVGLENDAPQARLSN